MDFFDTADEAIDEVELFEQFIPLDRFKEMNLVPIIFLTAKRANARSASATDSKTVWINSKWFRC